MQRIKAQYQQRSISWEEIGLGWEWVPQSRPLCLEGQAGPAALTPHLWDILPTLSLPLWPPPALCLKMRVFGFLFLWAKWKNKGACVGGADTLLRVSLTSLRKTPKWSLSASLFRVKIGRKTTSFAWVSTLPYFTWVLGAGQLLGTPEGRLGRGEKVRSGAGFTLPHSLCDQENEREDYR